MRARNELNRKVIPYFWWALYAKFVCFFVWLEKFAENTTIHDNRISNISENRDESNGGKRTYTERARHIDVGLGTTIIYPFIALAITANRTKKTTHTHKNLVYLLWREAFGKCPAPANRRRKCQAKTDKMYVIEIISGHACLTDCTLSWAKLYLQE